MKINDLLKLSLITFSLLIASVAQAKQTLFNKITQEQNTLFQYQWLDFQQQKQSLEFTVPRINIFNRYRNFRAYKSNMANEAIKFLVKKHLRDNPLEDVIIEFSNSEGFYASISGADKSKVNDAYQQLAKLQQTYAQQYLADNFYHNFTAPNGNIAIKPDHARIANESVEDLKVLKPIILETVSVKNIRKVTNYVLGFVQNIPYSPLESRATSSGLGFSPPLKLLWENKGDCDSKVTLTLAILRTLMPRIKLVIVYIDNHAMFGIDIPPQGNETTINHHGTTYVLADPTGPAVVPLGILSEENKQIIYSGHYSVEAFAPLDTQEQTASSDEQH